MQRPRYRFALVSVLISMSTVLCADGRLSAQDQLPHRLSSFTKSDETQTLFVGGSESNFFSVVSLKTKAIASVSVGASGIADLKFLERPRSLIIAGIEPPSVFSYSWTDSEAFEQPTQATRSDKVAMLPGTPASVAVSDSGKVACITMTWEHSAALVALNDAGHIESVEPQIVPLPFPPKKVLALPNDQFLIADAFGGNLLLLDGNSGEIVHQRQLAIHHIGGISFDDSRGKVFITHQRLSSIAETSFDDIHWGTLMQNCVSSFTVGEFAGKQKEDKRLLTTRQLGDVGNGSADPAGLVAARSGHVFVAVSGTNQIAFWLKYADRPMFVDVDAMPTDVLILDDLRIVSLNRLSGTLTIIRDRHSPKIEATIGEPRAFDSQIQKGEAAFYSAKLSHDGWMSCSSCHVDGHSPDLLADTLGDGRHESPKRIPSLFHVHDTGPWSWTGHKPNLDDQIRQTLVTTMHGDEAPRATLGSVDSITQDLLAYMNSLKVPTRSKPTDPDIEHGRALFERQKCSQCHSPEQHFTTPETYDVGVGDEQGTRKFNPPSLLGLKHRRAYFHDARFKSMDDLLKNHPDQKNPLNETEMGQLKAFLLSL